MAEDLILYSTKEFSFITLSDAYRSVYAPSKNSVCLGSVLVTCIYFFKQKSHVCFVFMCAAPAAV